MSTVPWLDERERAQLAQLSFAPQRKSAGGWVGDRRSARRGTSLEFADYRNYAPGDDLRRLDWNLYARLERPYLKLYEDEEDLALHIILDASASMEWPLTAEEGQVSKWDFARHLSAALAYIALQNNDQLLITAISGAEWQTFGPYRGREHSPRMFSFLSAQTASGELDWNECLRSYGLRHARPGLLVLISDLLSADGHRAGLNDLLALGYETTIVHTLSPDEMEPTLVGELRLIDVENGSAREVTLDGRLRAQYARRVKQWQEGIRRESHSRGVRYLLARTDRPWLGLLMQDLRRARLLK
ncbi:MAG: DUF58 domain-containing protein [Chloroflexi bacterium]|nr:DUF58 domain-containing protein [Chloroflexota bacterium]